MGSRITSPPSGKIPATLLGIVGNRYRIVQNREAFDFLDGLLQDGVMRYESAGALRGGRIVWLLARLPSVDTIAEGDDTLRYVLFNTSHDGSASIHAIPTSVRVVCANTLRIATAGDIGFRHTANVASKLEFAKKYLSQFDEKFTLFRDKARTLATRRYSPDDAKGYIETLFPPVKEIGRSRSIRENKVNAVRANFRNSRQSIPSIKGTWWSLFNAVTEAVDHERGWPSPEASRFGTSGTGDVEQGRWQRCRLQGESVLPGSRHGRLTCPDFR